MGDNKLPRQIFDGFINSVISVVDGPVTWFRERVVTPNRESYPWYHQKFRRVPTIDECYTDDRICFYEANEQFKRDKDVENEILTILRVRLEDCTVFNGPDAGVKCKDIFENYKKAETNWFCKYGDLGRHGTVKDAYMKQKHRMVWERRHGPVGSGMRETPAAAEE
ncbi:NADH dehydrogenase [ubiquinone] 1 beta subcomplex subunit 10 [Neocloeon triangulifer]|uniref:NADH dehydrogenase [ubiquinone] 1 beta subcomplex subunit 10 n=1 Tax=Neocloeon triangulifer TaxID=2078957 RepID=UPI00286F81C8|nr:NADH dehydrogenase [ubiquinone] 1 beta subcomplex subunit 10 [Neocloeon triangulifer]